eukprot:7535628-Heterocapsa_arctica.AAC.1
MENSQEMAQMFSTMKAELIAAMTDNVLPTMMAPMIARMDKMTSMMENLAAQVQDKVQKAVMVFVEAKMELVDARLADMQAKLTNLMPPDGEFFDTFDGPPSKVRRRE